MITGPARLIEKMGPNEVGKLVRNQGLDQLHASGGGMRIATGYGEGNGGR